MNTVVMTISSTQYYSFMYSWIRGEREKRKLSQSKLAQLSGIAQVYLSAWEHKKSEPDTEQVEHLRAAFSKFDSMIISGEAATFLKKTRWSKAYNSSHRQQRERKAISISEIEGFANSVKHTSRSSQRFSREHAGNLKYNGISLFSGCGGFSLGFHEAGIHIVAHAEINEAARIVFEKNFPSSFELGHDVRTIDQNRLNESKLKLPDIDIIFGGPPCQGFSLTGKRDVYDPRNQLYKDYARFVDVFRPKVFVLENVRLLTSMKTPSGSLLIDDLLETFQKLGYCADYKELNALNYGVPQSRERVIVIGINKTVFPGKDVVFPRPTHGEEEASLFKSFQRRPLSLRAAIGDLEHLESGERSKNDPLHFAVSHPSHVIRMLKEVPEGGSAHDNADPALRPTSGYNTTYKRLRWDEPASTIATTFGMISGSRNVHPTATRSLTVREAMRCQTFPDDFLIFGKLGEIRTMIGNAVPPTLSFVIAQHLITQYLSADSSIANAEMIKVAGL